jgi:hypothetical protein
MPVLDVPSMLSASAECTKRVNATVPLDAYTLTATRLCKILRKVDAFYVKPTKTEVSQEALFADTPDDDVDA